MTLLPGGPPDPQSDPLVASYRNQYGGETNALVALYRAKYGVSAREAAMGHAMFGSLPGEATLNAGASEPTGTPMGEAAKEIGRTLGQGVAGGVSHLASGIPLLPTLAAELPAWAMQGAVNLAHGQSPLQAMYEAHKNPVSAMLAPVKGAVQGATDAAVNLVAGQPQTKTQRIGRTVGGIVGDLAAPFAAAKLARLAGAAQGAEPAVESPAPEAQEVPRETPTTAPEPEYLHAGPGVTPEQRGAIRTAYRSAMVTPYAELENQNPALAQALNEAGAGRDFGRFLAERRGAQILDGLTPKQAADYGKRVVQSRLEGEVMRKAAAAAAETDPAEAQRLAQAAAAFKVQAANPDLATPPGIELEPWFQSAAAKHQAFLGAEGEKVAQGAGVNPQSFYHGDLPYVRLVPKTTEGEPVPMVGVPGRGTSRTGSAKMATGGAASYETDLPTILQADLPEKAARASRNAAYQLAGSSGRVLGRGERPAEGMGLLGFDDRGQMIPDAKTAPVRVEVTPEVVNAFRHFHRMMEPGPTTPAGRGLRWLGQKATSVQLTGVPGIAVGHMNSLASSLGSVPTTEDVAGSLAKAVPGVGGKAEAIREMMGVDFNDPAVQAVETRLARIGALRPQLGETPAWDVAHRALFGPTGADPRARIILAQRYLAREPDASDAALREFVTSIAGNYVRANQGSLPRFIGASLEGTGLNPFANYGAARIPFSIRSGLGLQTGLPAHSVAQRLSDATSTLWQGPVGAFVLTAVAGKMLSGHWPTQNEPGHFLDLDTGLTAVPGRIRARQPGDDQDPNASPIYIPLSTLNQVAATATRATGLRNLLPTGQGQGPPVHLSAGERAGSAAIDVGNTALGFAAGGPFSKAVAVAATGHEPYMTRGGRFLRVSPNELTTGGQILGNLRSAARQMNPAIGALTSTGGDFSRNTLGKVLAEPGRFGGGPASLAAKAADVLLPRMTTTAVGGASEATNLANAREDRLREWVADRERMIGQAPTPEERQRLVEEFTADAKQNGYNPDLVYRTLARAAAKLPVRAALRERNAERFMARNPGLGVPVPGAALRALHGQ